MPFYLIDTRMGRCVREAPSLRAARSAAIREHGTANFDEAKLARPEDLLEVKRWGGYLPDAARPIAEALERKSEPQRSTPS